jgi:dsDNA-specific endonuclease/ATPase MutS2
MTITEILKAKGVSEELIQAIQEDMKANSIYTIKRSLSETKAKVKIVAGSREQKSIRDSAKLLHEATAGSSMEILSGLRHGDLSMNKPEQYAKILINWIGRKPHGDEI